MQKIESFMLGKSFYRLKVTTMPQARPFRSNNTEELQVFKSSFAEGDLNNAVTASSDHSLHRTHVQVDDDFDYYITSYTTFTRTKSHLELILPTNNQTLHISRSSAPPKTYMQGPIDFY
jgi:hypothetical protein